MFSCKNVNTHISKNVYNKEVSFRPHPGNSRRFGNAFFVVLGFSFPLTCTEFTTSYFYMQATCFIFYLIYCEW